MIQTLTIFFLVLVQICLSTNPNKKPPQFPHLDRILRPKSDAATQEAAVRKMIARIIPEVISNISVHINPQLQTGVDSFLISSSGGKLQITGTTGVAVAWGLNYFLKTYCGCMITWGGRQLKLPERFPEVASLKISAAGKVRYYQNPVVESYSYAFWAWPRWEEELDWMALNGINLPLAFVAQEAVWKRVWLKEGLTSKELDDFFGGPAFLAWARMGNLHGWGGPLSDSWHTNQLQLQQKILRRMHEFGMIPVLPGFGGVIPEAFKRIHPKAKVTYASWYTDDKYNGGFQLQPDDHLFVEIGRKFVLEMIETFNYTAHVYNVNTYNELLPPTSKTVLAEAAKAVQKGLQTGDPEAIWLMNDWGVKDWPFLNAKAYITAIPKDRRIILDQRGTNYARFQRFKSYFGYPFIYGMIQDFGGQNSMFGDLFKLNRKVIDAFNNKKTAYSLIGTGINPEGINQNEIQYELMNEFAWKTKEVNLAVWTQNYYQRRYGIGFNTFLNKGWNLLLHSVYTNGRPSIADYLYRPKLSYREQRNKNKISAAWTMFSDAATTNTTLANSVLFRYDLVDVTKQAMGVGATTLQRQIVEAHCSKNIPKLNAAGKQFIELLMDIDKVLASDGHFLLGKWIDDAKKIGTTEGEKKLLEFNARTQVTTWSSGQNGVLNDYAAKQWAGLIGDYYAKRWAFFVKTLSESLVHKKKFNQDKFNKDCFEKVEKPFTMANKEYTTKPIGDSIELAKKMRIKWQHILFKESAASKLRCENGEEFSGFLTTKTMVHREVLFSKSFRSTPTIIISTRAAQDDSGKAIGFYTVKDQETSTCFRIGFQTRNPSPRAYIRVYWMACGY